MSGPHQKLAIPKRAGGAVPQAQGGGSIYVPGQDGGARLQPGDMGAAGYNAQAKAAAQGAEGIANLGRALDGAIQTGLSVYEKYQAAKAQNAFNEYQRGEMLQRAELDKLRGENALGENGVKARFSSWRKEARERLADQLAPMARAMFIRQADLTDAKSEVWISGKENRELKIFEDKASEGTILNAQTAVLQNPGDEAQMARSAGVISAELARQGERNGWGPEYVTAKTDEATRKLAGQRIEALFDSGDLDGAERAIKAAQQGARVNTGKMKPEWVEHARRMADKYNLPQNVFLGLIMQESGGNQNAVSSKKCIGLTQLHPDTAKEQGVNPYDPFQNIEGGAKYLRKMINQFGSLEKGLIAYNWGPGNMRAYLKTGRGSIGQARPKESLEYVDRVYGRISGGMLLPGDAGKYRKQIDAERKRQAAEARRAELERRQAQFGEREDIKLQANDALAAFQNGVVPDYVPSYDELEYAYKNNAPKMRMQLDDGRILCANLQLLPKLDGKMQQQLLKDNKPEPGEGYAIRAKNHATLARAIEVDGKKRKEDPALYVASHDEAISQAGTAFMEDQTPENWQAYRGPLDKKLAAIGLPIDKRLSKPMAQAMTDSFNKTKDKLGLQQKWHAAMGADFYPAFSQISKDLGDETRFALAIAGTRGGRDAAKTLLEIAGDKDFLKNAKQLIAEWPEKGDAWINAKVAEVCSPFNQTLFAGQFLNMPDMAVSALEAVKKYGAWLALNEGMKLEKAFDKAADLFFNDRYEFNSVNGRRFRVPKSAYLDNYRIVNGAGEMLKKIANNRDEYMVAGDRPNSGMALFKKEILENGYFVTDKKEAGLVLFINGKALRHAKEPDRGKIVSFDWATFMEMSTPEDRLAQYEDEKGVE